MEMYTWKVKLEVKWKYTETTTSTGKTRTWTDIDRDDFTVAASSGIKAIERAKVVALNPGRAYKDDWSDEDLIISGAPQSVVDVYGLELLDTLDG